MGLDLFRNKNCFLIQYWTKADTQFGKNIQNRAL